MEFLAATFRAKPLAHWMEWLGTLDICYGPVNTLPEAIADPNLVKRGAIVIDRRRPQALRARRALQGRAVAAALSRAAAGRAYGGSAGASRRAQETGRVSRQARTVEHRLHASGLRQSLEPGEPPRGHHAVGRRRHLRHDTLQEQGARDRPGRCRAAYTFRVGQYRFALDAYAGPFRKAAARWTSTSWSPPKGSFGRRPALAPGLAQALQVRPVQFGERRKSHPFLACQLAQGQAAPNSTEELAVRRLPLARRSGWSRRERSGMPSQHGAAGRRAACPQGTPRSPVEVALC